MIYIKIFIIFYRLYGVSLWGPAILAQSSQELCLLSQAYRRFCVLFCQVVAYGLESPTLLFVVLYGYTSGVQRTPSTSFILYLGGLGNFSLLFVKYCFTYIILSWVTWETYFEPWCLKTFLFIMSIVFRYFRQLVLYIKF